MVMDMATAAQPPSQATQIEQSRAVAEVQAAVVVAQQRPRQVQTALAELAEVCRQKELADRAFFRYSRGEGQVTGPTIHLARELARIWGNVSYGITELARDDAAARSEMLAWAWDLQTNTRASNTFIAPHVRDTKRGRKNLVDLRDVYENNANLGSRRAREMIFAILPSWFVERGKELCSATLRDGGGIPLPQRIEKSIAHFADRWGVTVDQLETKLGRHADRWNEHDLASLRVVAGSLERGEATIDEEFERPRVTAEEIIGPPPLPPPPSATAASEPAPTAADPQPWPAVTQPPDRSDQQ